MTWPVEAIASGGMPVTEVSGAPGGVAVSEVVGGYPVTITASGGLPVSGTTSGVGGATAGEEFGIIAEPSGTNESEVDVSLSAESDAAAYIIEGKITCTTAGASIMGRVSNDGFVSVESGSVYQTASPACAGSVTIPNGSLTPTTAFTLVSDVDSTGGAEFHGEIRILLPHDTSGSTGFLVRGQSHTASNNPGSHYGGGMYLTAESIDGIRLYASAGNLTYDLRVWKLPAS